MGLISVLRQTVASAGQPAASKSVIGVDSVTGQVFVKNDSGQSVLIPGIPGRNPPNGLSSLTAPPTPITTVETIVRQAVIPANSVAVGTTIHVIAFGAVSAAATGSVQGRIRLGAAGTTADSQVCASGAVGSVTAAIGFKFEATLTFDAIGAGGTVLGNCSLDVASATPALGISNQSATVAVDTTSAKTISVSFVGAGTTPSISIYNAYIDLVQS